MTHIASSVPGRIRFRDTALRDPSALAGLESVLGALDGVTSTHGNAVAGSIVVRYERARIKPGGIVQAVAATLGGARPGAARPLKLRVNRYVKIGALSTLSVSLMLAAARRRGAHAALGCAFLACLGAHLYINRRTLMR